MGCLYGATPNGCTDKITCQTIFEGAEKKLILNGALRGVLAALSGHTYRLRSLFQLRLCIVGKSLGTRTELPFRLFHCGSCISMYPMGRLGASKHTKCCCCSGHRLHSVRRCLPLAGSYNSLI